MEHTVRFGARRHLQVLERGARNGQPIFWLHGTPGARIPADEWVRDATARGIRLIGYDRPGYGGSSRIPDRTVGAVANEVAAIADSLGIERFGVWGFSGGGAPALACAAALPKRVVAAACLSGVAPYEVKGLDWTAGMGELNVAEYKLMLSDRPAFEKLIRQERRELLKATPARLVELWGSLISPVDRAAVDRSMARTILRQVQEGLRPSVNGMLDDNLSQAKPWGFDVSAIRVPVQLWHGRQDWFVPFAHAQWLATRITGAEPHFFDDEGHVSLLRHVPEVHSWLLSRF